MENKFQQAKNYNYMSDLALNNYVDTKDTVNHWCVGMVVDVDDDKNQVKVHFEGWTTRYDEWLKKNSQRLAPFRRHTEGYTGQKKTAFRDFKINYTQHRFMQQQVNEIIESDFKKFESPAKLTQFIRGELYFYVDSLISLFGSTTSEDLPAIFEFMQDVFKLIFKWMEIFPSYLKSFYDSLQHPQLYLVDYDAAIAQCGNELFGILEKCFGGCARCYKFFQRFDQEYIFEGDKVYCNKEKIKTNGLMMSFLNAFGILKGFDKILEFIKFEVNDPKLKTSKGCPFILTMKLLRAFTRVFAIADKNFSLRFAESIQNALTTRLDNLSDNEIKELDKDILRETVDVMKYYIQVVDPQNADMIAELYELKIAQKYLRGQYFEKRVRGINELKDIYYKVMNGQVKSRTNDQYEYTKWLNPEKYAQWIINERIVEFIFIDNPHVELIKRSSEILKLLASDEKSFSPDIIDMLWNCCREKHEDIVRATLDLIQDLALILPLDRLGQFFSKLQSIRENEFDEKMVTFLKSYTLNTIKNIRLAKRGESRQGLVNTLLRNKKEIKIDESKYIDLHKFWLIFQDSNKVPQKVKDLALNCLIEILQEYNEKDLKESFTQLAIDNIKKGETFYSSIIFLRKILNTYPLDSQIRFKTSGSVATVSAFLSDIFKKIDLFDLILQNANDYLKAAQLQKIAKQQKLGQGEKLQNQCLVGYATHEDYIQVIMSFIEFVLVNSKVTLTFDNIEKMFNIFVVKAVTEYESNALFQLITKENESAKSKERRFLLDDKVRNEVFQKIFCNNKCLNSEKINSQGFTCFKRLFLIVNEEEKALEVQKEDRVSVNNLNQLQGLDTLWSIAIQCENQTVKEVCRDFLVDLYLKIKAKTAAQKKQINELFPQRCLQYFKQAHERADFQLNCLRLIKTFIARFDGEHIQDEDMTQYDKNEFKMIQVTLNPDKAVAQVRVHPNQKIWQLKRKMAQQFKLRLSEFFIKTKQGPLEEHIYDEQIKEYKIESLHINRVPQEEMEKEFPRYLIGYSGDYLSLFLELLQTGKEECKREVLSLLEVLPINVDVKVYIKEGIYKMPQGSTNDWQNLFGWNGTSFAKPCYFLMSLEDLMIPKKDSPNPELVTQEIQMKQEFTLKFLQNGGFYFLFEIFQNLNKKNLENDIIKTKILAILLRLITHLFTMKQTSHFKLCVTAQYIDKLISETLSIIESFVMGVKNQQAIEIPQSEYSDVRLLKKDQIILSNSFAFLNRSLLFNPQLLKTVYQFPNIGKVFRTALIEIEIETIQRLTYQLIFELCIKLDLNQALTPKPSFFFVQLFITECLEYSLKVENYAKTKNFFELLNEVFTKTEMYKDLHQIQPVDQLAQEIAAMITSRDIIEMSARDEDIPLQGLFSFLKNIFLKFQDVRDKHVDKNKFLHYLINDCLFHKETRGQMIQKQKAMPPKCKNTNTRERCLELLNEVCQKNDSGIYLLIRYLKNYIKETFWRTPRKGDWAISVHQQERSLTGFVGLKNIGCICYMNSIMQQLFMIPTFRKSVLEVEDSNFQKEPTDENVLFQLKMIFGGLMEIEKQYYNPKKFCGAFKDIDGSPIDPLVQRDVDEFFNMMVDRIENLIKGKKEERVIKNLFQGVLANEFICKGCPHYSEREEPFLTINLQVKNKHSIKESLDAFVEGEMLEGDNAYFCEKCEKKVNTLKRCCIKRMPNVMFMVLKRFEFNFDTMTKFKINDYCEFPMSINMSEYSQEVLAKKDLLKEMEDKNLTMEDLNEEQREILEKAIPQKYYEYNLKGAVIHIGTAEQGHYISIIQDRENPNGKWFEFNDHQVSSFDPADIPDQAFGGEDDSYVGNLNFQNMQGSGYNEQMIQAMKQMKTKIKNAYILIYEREEIIDMEKFNEFMDDPNINTNKQEIAYRFEQCKLPKTSSAQIQIPPPVHDVILEKNKKFWLSKFIFNKSYIESVLNIFRTISIEEDSDYNQAREANLQTKNGTQLEVFKFLTTFFLTTVLRAKERKTVPSFMKLIREALEKNVSLSVWVLEAFSSQDLIKEFLIDCPIPDMKRFVAGLLKTAMQTVYKFEEQAIQDYSAVPDSGIMDYVNQTQGQYIKHHRQVDMRQSTTKGQAINTGLCTNLNLFTITHHNKQLPVLIIMINSFIHLNVSTHYLRNWQLCGQFYQVFGHFSELGENARLYLLKSKSIGRLLDLFLNDGGTSKQTMQISEKFKNETLQTIPLFQLDKELYLESNLEKNDVFLSIAERKLAISSATSPYTFLLYTVSKLSRSCRFVKTQNPNPFANDSLNFVLDNDELGMLINHEHEQWWNNCTQKVSRNAVSDMYAYISFENKEFSLQILNTLLAGLQKASFDYMKIYERPLLKMLMIKDSYQVDRTKKAVQGLHEIMKSNTSYYREVDCLIDFVYKLAQRSLIVVELINKTSSFYRLIEQWNKEYPHFPLNQTKTRIFRQGVLQWQSLRPNQINQTIIDKVSQYQKDRLVRLQQLIQKETPVNENAYDSDDDLYHHKFQQSEKIDFCDLMENWFTGTVEIALDEMVKCVSETVAPNQKQILFWIGTECDQLALPHTQTSSEKKKMHQFYMTLLRSLNAQS